MSRLDQLYQEMILEHNKNPRNFGVLEPCSHFSHGKNPLCGDDFFVFLDVKDGVINDVKFDGAGCAISKSSASLMTTAIKGQVVEDVLRKKDLFLKMVTEAISPEEEKELGKLKVFSGVKKYPVRVKCAALIWRALENALEHGSGSISTE